MIGTILYVAFFGFALVQSDPLWRREKRSSSDEMDSANKTTIDCRNEAQSTEESSGELSANKTTTDCRNEVQSTEESSGELSANKTTIDCRNEAQSTEESSGELAQSGRVDKLCDAGPSGQCGSCNSTDISRMSSEQQSKTTITINEAAASPSICLICYKEDREILFVPCKHLIACTNCSVTMNTCTMCKELIQCMIKVFL